MLARATAAGVDGDEPRQQRGHLDPREVLLAAGRVTDDDGEVRLLVETALDQAKAGRMHILGEMSKALTSGRTEFSAHAPRIETMQVAVDKIREVIGTGGKVIREICEVSGAKIDIEDDGTIANEGTREFLQGFVDKYVAWVKRFTDN